jgi:hypothetical protein
MARVSVEVTHPSGEWAPQPSGTVAVSARTDLSALPAFAHAGRVVAASLEPLVGPMEVLEAPAIEVTPGEAAAYMVLSFACEEAELCITLVLEKPSVAAFSRDVFDVPEPSDSDAADMVRELANIAAGSVKIDGAGHGIGFTTNLPVSARPVHDDLVVERSWWLQRSGGDGRLGVIASIRDRPNEWVAASELREGMIVVNDVLDMSGFTVVHAGARLTATGAKRLPTLVGGDSLIEVAVAT